MRNKRKTLDAACLRLWSLNVRAGGKCQMCGREDGKLDAHHLMARTKRATRYDLNNGVALCFRCHRLMAHSPDFQDQQYFHAWVRMNMTEEILEDLRYKSNQVKKYSISELENIKTALKERLNV